MAFNLDPAEYNLRRPHSTDDLLDERRLEQSFVRPRPKPAPRTIPKVSTIQAPVPTPRRTTTLVSANQKNDKAQLVNNEKLPDKQDAESSLILLSPENRSKVAKEFFNMDLDVLYNSNGSSSSSTSLKALDLQSPNSDWYNDSYEIPRKTVFDQNFNSTSQRSSTGSSSYVEPNPTCFTVSPWGGIADPVFCNPSAPHTWYRQTSNEQTAKRPFFLDPVPPQYKVNPYWTPESASSSRQPVLKPDQTANKSWSVTGMPGIKDSEKSTATSFSNILPVLKPQNGDLLDLSKDLITDTRGLTLRSFDPFADTTDNETGRGLPLASDKDDPFLALWDTSTSAEAGIDPFKVPETKSSGYERLDRKTGRVPVYAQMDHPLYKLDSCETEERQLDSVYESVHTYEEIRDPFSVTELSQVLEHQKKMRVANGRASITGKGAITAKPKRPPPPLVFNTEEAAMFEPLRQKIGASEEELAFCDMVARMKAEYTYEDNLTNHGFLISPVVDNMPCANMSVKVSVETKFSVEPVVFTCDLSTTVEHMVVQVLSVLSDDNMTDICTDEYVFKLHGVSEYLVLESRLGDYVYTHQCIKMDEDIQLVLVDVGNVNKSLLRTNERPGTQDVTSKDDLEPVVLSRPDDRRVVNRETMGILLDTFYKEINTVRERALQPTAVKVQCQSLIQSVKAICAILGNVETNAISTQVLKLNTLSEIECPFSEEMEEDGAIYAIIDRSRDNAKTLQVEEFQDTIDQLVVSVKHLVHTYCRTFNSDFSFGSLHKPCTDTSLKDVTVFEDFFIVELESAHRLPVEWKMTYEKYCIICALYHGGRKVHSEVATSYVQITEGFTDKLCWDEWIQMRIPVCTLPRECRLVFSLVGIRTASQSSGAEPGQQVRTSLGWAAMQVFDYKGLLVQGPQLIPLWPGDPQPLGTTLTNRGATSVLLKIALPDFECQVEFPKVLDSPESHACDFGTLNQDLQEELKEIIAKDVITNLTTEESEFLWEKRHYMYHYPKALSKILDYCHGWDWLCLPDLHAMVSEWDPLEPAQALELLLPRYADTHVRRTAVRWIKAASSDELCDYLPQLVQALKYESYSDTPLARFLLERSITSIRVAHYLFWHLRDAINSSPQFSERYQLMLRAVLGLVGSNLKAEFDKQESLVNMLSQAAELVRSAKDKEAVLMRELEKVYTFLQNCESLRIPLNPSMEITGIDLKLCSYFNSFTTPIKLVFKNINPKAGSIYSIFKVGDDLRQDMLIMQMVSIVNNMWMRERLDLKIITFSCLPTEHKKGMIELVTGCETLRRIQVTHAGLAGSFKDKPLYDWLQKHNPTELEFRKAVANFTASCAGYCVMTYVLGICDRHNDNIMIKETGHMFHIDFAKILGDSQMFGNIKRDRVPFVLTSDMAYVINGGDKPSERFQEFVDLCCQAFNIIRRNSDVLLNLILLMNSSGIPGVTTSAASYVQKALLPDFSDAEATAFFTRLIEESLRSLFVQINFFIHNLAQLKFHGHEEGELLSFIPKTYSLQTDGKIRKVEVHGFQKRYSPDKYYVYVIKVERVHQKVSSFVFRRYSEFLELHRKLVVTFPLAKLPTLPSRLILGRSHVKTVAERRKGELQLFLRRLLETAPEIAECDLVYTFFHPMLRDEQEVDKANMTKIREPSTKRTSVAHSIGGQVKLSLVYKDGALQVMVMHAQKLANCGGEEPDPYVKTYMLPDPQKVTKKKTKICRNTFHPTFNEMLIYQFPYEEILQRTLQVSVWNDISVKENEFLGAVLISLHEIDLTKEQTQWYTLAPLHTVSIT